MAKWRSPENADTICDMIANGYTLRQIARDVGLSSQSRIIEWVQSDPAFAERYARAMDIRTDMMAEELVEIADDGSNDWMEREGHTVLNGEHVQRSRLRADTRKWLMAKMMPKKYGEFKTIDATHTIRREVSDMSEDELRAIASRGGPGSPSADRGPPEPSKLH